MKLYFLSIFYTWMTSFISLKPFNLKQNHLNLKHENNNPINSISEQPKYKYYYNYKTYKQINLNFTHIDLDNITNIYHNDKLLARFNFNDKMLIFYEYQYKYIKFINNKKGLPIIFNFYIVYENHNALSSTITQKLNLNDEYICSSSIFNKTNNIWSIYSYYSLNGDSTYLYFVDSYISNTCKIRKS